MLAWRAPLVDSLAMLHAVQPWLPLLHPELSTEPLLERPGGAPRRKPRRKPVEGTGETRAGLSTSCTGEQRAARQAYLGLVACWDLSAADALRLLGEPVSGEDERTRRLEALLGARRSLGLIVPEPARCAALLRRPEPALEGASMLQAMLVAGLPAIERVRAHLAGMARRP